jgi:hypothetical protein
MMIEVAVLVLTTVCAALLREYYGNKGMFVLPKLTEKGLALGSFTAVFAAIFAVLTNFALVPQGLSLSLAVSLGFSWGIAAPDVVANLMGRMEVKQ